ncbi:hypothetical protein D3C75_997890 [compost metagenome]
MNGFTFCARCLRNTAHFCLNILLDVQLSQRYWQTNGVAECCDSFYLFDRGILKH